MRCFREGECYGYICKKYKYKDFSGSSFYFLSPIDAACADAFYHVGDVIFFNRIPSLSGMVWILFKSNLANLLKAFGMSIAVTGIGTGLHILIAPMFAYPLSRQDYKHARFFTLVLFVTMMLNGGMVGQYLMWTNLFHIKNTIWALIFPNLLFTAFQIVLYKNSFANNIHPALIEAAKIDGASELYTYFKVVLPLSKPILATVGLMVGIGYWNDWINGQYYITDTKLYSLQVMLTKIMQNLQLLVNMGDTGITSSEMPGVSVRMAIAVIGTIPILVLYPFFQKAFVAGISLGGVKE